MVSHLVHLSLIFMSFYVWDLYTFCYYYSSLSIFYPSSPCNYPSHFLSDLWGWRGQEPLVRLYRICKVFVCLCPHDGLSHVFRSQWSPSVRCVIYVISGKFCYQDCCFCLSDFIRSLIFWFYWCTTSPWLTLPSGYRWHHVEGLGEGWPGCTGYWPHSSPSVYIFTIYLLLWFNLFYRFFLFSFCFFFHAPSLFSWNM